MQARHDVNFPAVFSFHLQLESNEMIRAYVLAAKKLYLDVHHAYLIRQGQSNLHAIPFLEQTIDDSA